MNNSVMNSYNMDAINNTVMELLDQMNAVNETVTESAVAEVTEESVLATVVQSIGHVIFIILSGFAGYDFYKFYIAS